MLNPVCLSDSLHRGYIAKIVYGFAIIFYSNLFIVAVISKNLANPQILNNTELENSEKASLYLVLILIQCMIEIFL
ncbi:hypothetical protein BpHYR1_050225 [Brachionus plicatilis]|uniref:Uncharacterized protein n=1 Tax=Brachionus plicatilis TaxID=10195 RepID=A0A3M7RJX7_BRAPC|nr:hypothetical protein BpHYR1_050225 [Brachionus plicatilis]